MQVCLFVSMFNKPIMRYACMLMYSVTVYYIDLDLVIVTDLITSMYLQ